MQPEQFSYLRILTYLLEVNLQSQIRKRSRFVSSKSNSKLALEFLKATIPYPKVYLYIFYSNNGFRTGIDFGDYSFSMFPILIQFPLECPNYIIATSTSRNWSNLNRIWVCHISFLISDSHEQLVHQPLKASFPIISSFKLF